MAFPFGDRITVTYPFEGTSPQTMVFTESSFQKPGGVKPIDRYGHFRKDVEPDLISSVESMMRRKFYVYPVGRPAQEFETRLWLSSAEYYQLKSLVDRMSVEHGKFLLIDERYAMSEPTTGRIRAMKGTPSGAPTNAGTTYFWGKFLVIPRIDPEIELVGCGTGERYGITMTCTEFNVLDPGTYDE